MVDEQIRVDDSDALTAQARLHREMRDHLRQIVGGFDSRHNAIASQLDGGQAAQYQQWWQTLRAHLLKQAQQHDEFAQRLDDARATYAATEARVNKTFTPH